MIDREKVVKGLERLRGKEQFFTKQSDEKFPDDLHELIGVQDLAADALALLKEQKTEWVQISPAKIYECKVCGQTVMTDNIDCYKFCHGCGRPVKLND